MKRYINQDKECIFKTFWILNCVTLNTIIFAEWRGGGLTQNVSMPMLHVFLPSQKRVLGRS